MGTRVPVRKLLLLYREGVSIEKILKQHAQLPPAKILDALAFALDNPEVMEVDLLREGEQKQRKLRRHHKPLPGPRQESFGFVGSELQEQAATAELSPGSEGLTGASHEEAQMEAEGAEEPAVAFPAEPSAAIVEEPPVIPEPALAEPDSHLVEEEVPELAAPVLAEPDEVQPELAPAPVESAPAESAESSLAEIQAEESVPLTKQVSLFAE